ncbi:MAG TPA: hypothetical protein PKO06_12850, partial [Candidatus Ozemobacteraceae bacterium]|nr:hypothetical protein [Candidatus Ozemobacteraceae bacterium]
MRVPSVVGLRRSVRRLGFLSVPMIIILVVILFVAWQFFYWTFCRIEIDPGMSGVLIAKMGTDLPPGEIIATQTGYKGIQFDVLSEGRHFYN